MRKLDVCLGCREDDVSVGALAEDRGRIYFQYDASFLDRRLELSPFRLPLQPGLIEHRDREFGPLPGLFDDSLPDGWGLLLMDRHFRARGLQSGAITPLDRLAWLGQRTMGALTYHPSSDEAGVDNRRLDLRDMAHEATAILAGTTQDVLPRLLRAGGSPGGARPKVLVGLRLDRDEVISGADEPPPGYEPGSSSSPARPTAVMPVRWSTRTLSWPPRRGSTFLRPDCSRPPEVHGSLASGDSTARVTDGSTCIPSATSSTRTFAFRRRTMPT